MLEAEAMPPEDEAQPSDELRAHLIAGIRKELAREARARAGDPGHVVLRRLTNVEYRHTIRSLTGLNWQPDGDIVDDAVGGEGFANVGTVQFIQAPTLKRYLALAHDIASHAVVGAGPLRFSRFSQQKDGWELSAITRIQEINRTHGFSPGSGEGGEPYGTQRYIDAFHTAWRYLHRGELGLGEQTLAELTAADGLDFRFVDHIWTVMNDPAPSFPTVEVARKWRALPGPNDDADRRAPDDIRVPRCEGHGKGLPG